MFLQPNRVSSQLPKLWCLDLLSTLAGHITFLSLLLYLEVPLGTLSEEQSPVPVSIGSSLLSYFLIMSTPHPQGRLRHLGPMGFTHLFTDIYWASALPRLSLACSRYSSVENAPSPCPQGVYSLTENTVITMLTGLVLPAEEMHRARGLHDGNASGNLEAQEGQLRNWYQSVPNSEGWVDGQVKKKTVSGKRNIFS